MKLVANVFISFTCFVATGHWQGTPERSLVIEIASNDHSEEVVHELATRIKKLNKQDAVLVQKFNSDNTLI